MCLFYYQLNPEYIDCGFEYTLLYRVDYTNKDRISLERKVLPALVSTEKLHVYRLDQFWSQVKSGG